MEQTIYKAPLDEKLSLRLLTMFLILAPMIPLRDIIAPNDQQGYLEYVANAADASEGSLAFGKVAVGLFFAKINSLFPYWVFTNTVFGVYLFYMSLSVRTLTAYMMVVIITLPMFIHFNYISKEAILLFIAVTGFFTARSFGRIKGIWTVAIGVIIFAVFIRTYYVLPIFATALVLWLGWQRGIIVILIGIGLSMLVFPKPFIMLEESRQTMYYVNVYKFNARSVFPYLNQDADLPMQLRSVINYGIVLFDTLFPLTWTRTIKDIFAQMFFFSLVGLCIAAIRKGDRVFSAFGFFVVLTVPFFVPDLGTAMRHTSAAATFLLLGIAFRTFDEGGAHPFRPTQVYPVF